MSVVGGLYVFDELDQINGVAIFSFCLGVIVTIGGVLFLSTQAPESASHGHTVNESTMTVISEVSFKLPFN